MHTAVTCLYLIAGTDNHSHRLTMCPEIMLLSFERQHLLRTVSQIGLAFSQKKPPEREVHHSIFTLLPIQPIMSIIIIIIIIIIINRTNKKVQTIFHVRINITCSINCEYRIVETLYTLETWFVRGIQL